MFYLSDRFGTLCRFWDLLFSQVSSFAISTIFYSEFLSTLRNWNVLNSNAGESDPWNWFYGQWSSQRPLNSIGVNNNLFLYCNFSALEEESALKRISFLRLKVSASIGAAKFAAWRQGLDFNSENSKIEDFVEHIRDVKPKLLPLNKKYWTINTNL